MKQGILIILIFMAVTVTAMFDGEPKEVKCKGEVIKGTVEFHKNMMSCIMEFKDAKEKKVENRKRGLKCLIICALTKNGIFDDKGAYNAEKMNQAIDMSLSAPLATMQKAEAGVCAKNIPAPVLDPADRNCNNYKPLLRCFKKGWMKTCVEGYDPDIMEDDEA